jgi:hypothetical protein
MTPKPCPFCGAEAILTATSEDAEHLPQIECQGADCGATMTGQIGGSAGVIALFAAWNRRHITEAQARATQLTRQGAIDEARYGTMENGG